ncbi:hypothetical protein CFC21_111794 [Triticum aestivum]|uniref:DNL-type domain-containing protein n=4 Tax=Triticinae TaxID=1648030 RepID=A0A3B6TT75_WHEAT|nr:hypothetical protein CFC21_111794 [Triticum aestivum]
MESVAIATTSRALAPPFPSAALRRRRRAASFVPVAAASKRARPYPVPCVSFLLLLRRCSRPRLPCLAGRDGGEGEDAGAHKPPRPPSSGGEPTGLAPYGLSFSPFSKDAAMGLVMSAATGSGWTTGSGMEGPPMAGGAANRPEVSTLPWSLFTKSPRRRMRVAFTCNVCGQRTTRAINPHAYTDGTVFVQCCGCNIFHKLVDNLNLFHEMKCYVGPDFRYEGDAPFNYLEGGDDDSGNIFPLL